MWTKIVEQGQKVKTKGNDVEVAGAAGSWELRLSGGSCRSGLVMGSCHCCGRNEGPWDLTRSCDHNHSEREKGQAWETPGCCSE